MEFPFFHLDFYGNRLLIAVIAILHVLINHPMAVGASLFIARLESRGLESGDPRWDRLAYRVLFLCFIVTTTVGALTGVGIWLSTALANPAAIGSLIRVFFWAWFAEWLVFVGEVGLILLYTLTWKSMTGARKRLHIRLGYALAAFSWITMALITAILGFMMHPGEWSTTRGLIDGILNPLYLPQLAFRTCLAMMMAGAMVLVLVPWVVEKDEEFRPKVVRACCGWMLAWGIPMVATGWWYLGAAPKEMLERAPTALGTMAGEGAYFQILLFLGALMTVGGYVTVTGWVTPKRIPRWTIALPFLILAIYLGTFERTREFIRKPWIISGYMYANGLRAEDYPLFQAEGLLKHHPYATVKEITDGNRLQAGAEVFQIACAGCHASVPGGVNSVEGRFAAMLGNGPWQPKAVGQIIANMHGNRTYMPEFPGIPAERRALAEWLVQRHRVFTANETLASVPAVAGVR